MRNLYTVPYEVTDSDVNDGIGANMVSVLILDSSDNIRYYAPLEGTFAMTGGSGTFELPADYTDTDRIYILAEDIHEGYPTDYASEPVELRQTYRISVEEAIANGTVTADKQTAAGGDTATLTVTPDAGYAIGSVSVNDGAVILTDNGNGTYTFTMPEADVTVSAVFEQLPKPKAKVTTAPTAKTGLTYTGKAQALITVGEADTYMEYSLDGTNYSETVPTGTNANIYTVYYRAAAVANHNAGYAVQLTVSVSRRSLKVTGVTATRRVFNGYPIINVTSVTLSGICGTDDVAVDTSSLTGELASADAGVYTSLTLSAGLALKGASEDNYTLIQPTAPVAADVTIDKAEPTINVTCCRI